MSLRPFRKTLLSQQSSEAVTCLSSITPIELGKEVLLCSFGKSFMVFDVETSTILRRCDLDFKVVCIEAVVIRDRTYVACCGGIHLAIVDFQTLEILHRFSVKIPEIKSLSLITTPRGRTPSLIHESVTYVLYGSSGDQSGTVFACDVQFGHKVFELVSNESKKAPLWAITSIKTDKETYAICGNFHGNMDIYSLSTGSYIHRLTGHSGLTFSITAYDGCAHGLYPVVISCSLDLSIRVWSLETGEQIALLKGHSNNIVKIAVIKFQEADPLLVSASLDKTICIWNLMSLKLLRTLTGHASAVNSFCAYSAADIKFPTIVSSSVDGMLMQWSTGVAERLSVLRYEQSPSFAVAMYPKYSESSPGKIEDYIFCTGQEDSAHKGVTCFWSLNTGKLTRTITGEHSTPVWHISILHELDLIATCAFGDRYAVIWRLSTGEMLERLSTAITTDLNPVMRSFWSINFQKLPRTGKYIIVGGSSDSQVFIWDLDQNYFGEQQNLNEKPADATGIEMLNAEPQLTVEVPNEADTSVPTTRRSTRRTSFKLPPELSATGRKRRNINRSNSISSESSGVSITNPSNVDAAITEPEKAEVPIQVPKVYKSSLRLVCTLSSDKAAARGMAFQAFDSMPSADIDADKFDGGLCELVIMCACRNGFLYFINESGALLYKIGNIGEGVDAVIHFESERSRNTIYCYGTLSGNIKVMSRSHSSTQFSELSMLAELSHRAGVKALQHLQAQDCPLLVSGHTDGAVLVWNIRQRALIYSLEGHTAMLFAFQVFSQNLGIVDPIMISIAVDHRIIVWDLYSLMTLPALKNDQSKLRPISNLPSQALAHVAKTIDHCSIPTFGNVAHAFELDKINFGAEKSDNSIHSWPRMSSLVEQYDGSTILAFATSYFFQVLIEDSRTDFIGKFVPHYPQIVLTKMVTDINLDKTPRSTSLLELAIVRQDQVCLHTIVNAWINLLQPDFTATTLPSAQKLHNSIQLERRELIELAKSFPGEFAELVKNLKLIQVHEDVVRDCKRLSLRIGDSLELGSNRSYHTKLWLDSSITLAASTAAKFPVTGYFVPLKDAAESSMLQLYVDVTEATQNVEIFNCEIVIHALQFAWGNYGQKVHYRAMMRYIIYMVFYSIANWATFYDTNEQCFNYSYYDNLSHVSCNSSNVDTNSTQTCSGGDLQTNAWDLDTAKLFNYLVERNCGFPIGLQLIVLVLALKYIKEEVVQYLMEVRLDGNNAYLEVAQEHFMDIWNDMDVIAFFGTVFGIVGLLFGYHSVPRGFLAVVSVCLWFKLLYFFRPFESTGPLVSMIFSILFDVRYFFLILLIIMVGFAQAFWLISLDDKTSDFSSLQVALLSVFKNSMGDPNFDFDRSSSPTLGLILLVVFLIVYCILLLNILIALMSDTFNRIQSNGLAQWRLERCKIILDQLHLISDKELSETPAYIHVLKRAEFVKPISDEFHTRMVNIYKNTAEILDHNKKIEEQVALITDIERSLQSNMQRLSEEQQSIVTNHALGNDADNQSRRIRISQMIRSQSITIPRSNSAVASTTDAVLSSSTTSIDRVITEFVSVSGAIVNTACTDNTTANLRAVL